jgi:hypothetical protein
MCGVLVLMRESLLNTFLNRVFLNGACAFQSGTGIPR